MPTPAYTTRELELLSATCVPPSDAASAGMFLIRGHILRDHNEIELAIEIYEMVLRWEPDNEAAFESIVSAHESRGDYERAMDYIIKAWDAGVGILDGVDLHKYAPTQFARLENALRSGNLNSPQA